MFYLRLCTIYLSVLHSDSLHFAWNVWKFDRTIADIEPHQGVPRLVTSSRQSRSSSLIRRGLAFMSKLLFAISTILFSPHAPHTDILSIFHIDSRARLLQHGSRTGNICAQPQADHRRVSKIFAKNFLSHNHTCTHSHVAFPPNIFTVFTPRATRTFCTRSCSATPITRNGT